VVGCRQVEAAKAEYRATHTRAAVDAEVNQVVGLVAAGEPFPLSMAPEGWKLLAAVPHAEPDVQVMTLEAELSRLTAEMQYYPIAQQRTADMFVGRQTRSCGVDAKFQAV
jgi:hypothetical protein